MKSFFQGGFGAGGSVGSVSDTGEETLGRGAGADNGTDCERWIKSDGVTKPCGGKYETNSKNVTSADTKYLLEGL